MGLPHIQLAERVITLRQENENIVFAGPFSSELHWVRSMVVVKGGERSVAYRV